MEICNYYNLICNLVSGIFGAAISSGVAYFIMNKQFRYNEKINYIEAREHLLNSLIEKLIMLKQDIDMDQYYAHSLVGLIITSPDNNKLNIALKSGDMQRMCTQQCVCECRCIEIEILLDRLCKLGVDVGKNDIEQFRSFSKKVSSSNAEIIHLLRTEEYNQVKSVLNSKFPGIRKEYDDISSNLIEFIKSFYIK